MKKTKIKEHAGYKWKGVGLEVYNKNNILLSIDDGFKVETCLVSAYQAELLVETLPKFIKLIKTNVEKVEGVSK